MSKRILITGAAGFIGSHVVRHILENTDWEIVTLDRLNISGNWNRFTAIPGWDKHYARVKCLVHDLRCEVNDQVAKEIGYVDYILHMGASTHVDRSIADPMSFVLDNVVGTTNILLFATRLGHRYGDRKLKAFVYFSTDEVFGPAPGDTAYEEWSRYNSGNPYAAAKAGGEEMALAFANTYGLPVIVTHTMNVFASHQHPEKFIPKVIRAVLNDEVVTIHANKEKTKAGSRFWIHARNVAAALLFLLERHELGEPNVIPHGTYWRMPNADKYNIVGEKEVDNLEMAQTIAKLLGKDLKYEMVNFHESRPGHDLRYGLSGKKLKEMGWNMPTSFEESLRETVEWYVQNKKWIS